MTAQQQRADILLKRGGGTLSPAFTIFALAACETVFTACVHSVWAARLIP